MRQTSLLSALVVIMIGGGAAAWYFLQPDESRHVNGALEEAEFANDPCSNPLTGGPAGNEPRSNRPRRPKPEPKPEPTPEPDREPEEGEWLLKGRIVPTPELEAILAMPREWSDSVEVLFLPDNKTPEDTASLYCGMDENRNFREIASAEDLGLVAGATPAGRWQVMHGHDGSTPPTFWWLIDEPGLALTCLYTPKIAGRVVDFGEVSVGVDDYFYNYVLMSGRLVHSSGIELAYSGTHVVMGDYSTEEEGWSIYTSFHTRGDGRFFAIEWFDHGDSLNLLAKYKWRYATEEAWWDDGVTSKHILSPAIKGHHLDFGDIKLEGALVEITLKGDFKTQLTPDGELAVNEWGEYEGDHASVSFDGGRSYYVNVYPAPRKTLLVVQEGRYTWGAWINSTEQHLYPEISGLLLARTGQTYVIEIEARPYRTIPLTIKPELLDGSCYVNWYVMKGEDDYHGSGSFSHTGESRIPVMEGYETSVYVGCPGYKDAQATASPGMAGLEVTLLPDDRPFATVVVVVPAYPKDFGIDKLGGNLRLDMPGESLGSYDQTYGPAPVEQKFLVHVFGKGKAALYGGANFGYANGVLSGPVEFDVAEGTTIRVELPPITDPPWPKPINSITAKVTASGSPINLVAFVRYQGLEAPWNDSISNGNTIPVRGMPVAITDGREDFAVQFTAGEDGQGTMSFEQAHNIEVRLVRGGQQVEAFSVWAQRLDVQLPDFPMQCEAFTTNGVAKLWIPRGKVNVDVRIDGGSVASTQTEILPGQVVRVDVESEYLQLSVEVPPNEYTPGDLYYEAPELWRLEYWGGEDDPEWYDYTSLSQSTTFMLGAGRYRFRPWNGSEAIEVEMTEDRVLQLPEIPVPGFGSVTLKFDVASLGELWVDTSFYYQFAHKVKVEQGWWEGMWCQGSLVPDGFKLEGIPMNIDLVVWGTAYVEEDEGWSLAMMPMTIQVTKDAQLVDAGIRRAVELHDEWHELDARWVTPVAGMFMSLDEALPTGRHELIVYTGDREIVVREWVTVPEQFDKPFRIPDGLRSELESKELIGPREPDEPEDD